MKWQAISTRPYVRDVGLLGARALARGVGGVGAARVLVGAARVLLRQQPRVLLHRRHSDQSLRVDV